MKENAPGLFFLSSIAFLACHFLYSGLDARAARARFPEAGEAPSAESLQEEAARLESAVRKAAQIISVKPSSGRVSGMQIFSDEIVFIYRDSKGALMSQVVMPEEAARHAERFRNAKDLAEFLRGFGDSPLIADAPLDDSDALRDWARGRLSAIDRPPAEQFPAWFRAPVAEGLARFDLR